VNMVYSKIVYTEERNDDGSLARLTTDHRDAILGASSSRPTVFISVTDTCHCPIVDSSISRYQKFECVPPIDTLSTDMQYLEVGAGLGAFIPYIVRHFGDRLKHKPIVIDPVDYGFVIALLEEGIARGLSPRHAAIAQENIARARIITDPHKVRLYNCTLEYAVRHHPELQGCADLVVELCGPSTYSLASGTWTDSLLNSFKKDSAIRFDATYWKAQERGVGL
jgi:hypothetical protein